MDTSLSTPHVNDLAKVEVGAQHRSAAVGEWRHPSQHAALHHCGIKPDHQKQPASRIRRTLQDISTVNANHYDKIA
jgi:hypothetical protein